MMERALLVGFAIGLFNGALCHSALYWVLEKPDRVFYSVWGAGFLYRLAFFGLAFWFLIRTGALPLVPALLALVFGQFVVGVIPLKRSKKS
jgi:hypothetical protein